MRYKPPPPSPPLNTSAINVSPFRDGIVTFSCTPERGRDLTIIAEAKTSLLEYVVDGVFNTAPPCTDGGGGGAAAAAHRIFYPTLPRPPNRSALECALRLQPLDDNDASSVSPGPSPALLPPPRARAVVICAKTWLARLRRGRPPVRVTCVEVPIGSAPVSGSLEIPSGGGFSAPVSQAPPPQTRIIISKTALDIFAPGRAPRPSLKQMLTAKELAALTRKGFHFG
jgi:hypothetical protein